MSEKQVGISMYKDCEVEIDGKVFDVRFVSDSSDNNFEYKLDQAEMKDCYKLEINIAHPNCRQLTELKDVENLARLLYFSRILGMVNQSFTPLPTGLTEKVMQKISHIAPVQVDSEKQKIAIPA